MDWFTIASLIFNAAVGIAAIVLGGKWLTTKGKIAAVGALVDTIKDALADEKITAEESKAIFGAAMAIIKS
ncbi:MAG: hypothetical protein KKG99_09990 [Bacteroidetes bacterium]|nr:hypothetical protein [Bacteroidota bacterium]